MKMNGTIEALHQQKKRSPINRALSSHLDGDVNRPQNRHAVESVGELNNCVLEPADTGGTEIPARA
jgi:hypothetical protein